MGHHDVFHHRWARLMGKLLCVLQNIAFNKKPLE
jgi:hypothetical protein